MTTVRPSFATAYDVARLAGVSQSAVSRTFTPGASVSAKTREKVMAAAQQLGYRPNILARSLIKQKSKLVGLISGYMAHPFFARMLERLAEQLSDQGLRVLVFTAENNESVDKRVDEMLSYQVTAMVLISVSVSSTLADECARAGIPVILLSRTPTRSGAVIEVVGDNEAGARAIAERFVDTGRTEIAFMAGYRDSPTSLVREIAFMDYFTERGLPMPRREVGNYTYEDAVVATRRLFAEPGARPDAIFCANDLMAIGVIDTLRSHLGLEPGRDCAVAGFDNIPMAGWPCFALTTYSQPIDAIVDEAVRIIIGKRDSKPGSEIIVEGEFVIRDSA